MEFIAYSYATSIRVSSRDTGKTMVDASLGEIMTTCEKITWLLSEGEKWLKPEYRYFSFPIFSLLSWVIICLYNSFFYDEVFELG